MRVELSKKLVVNEEVARAPNLTDRFSDDDLRNIGQAVWEGYELDENSRADWLRRNRAGMDLALQVVKTKSYPWPNASNVAFPLLTIATLQFNSRAYPALFSGPDIVKYRVPAFDPDGSFTARAQLVSRYMSYQALVLDESFEEQHDRLLITVPIVGCAFIKTRRIPREQRNVSELVPAEDLTIDYFAKSVDSARRKTQRIVMYRNDVYERCVAGTFRNVLDEPWFLNPSALPTTPDKDRATGRIQPPVYEGEELGLLEQHTWMDLDGDGYAEPYIITIDHTSKQVLRIVARWEMDDDVERVMMGGRKRIMRINQTEYFTKYGLIPSPDGSIYDLGFGALLGPLNESVNSIINQLVDAGTLKNQGGGFLAKGVKVRGGAMEVSFNKWTTVESSGDDLRKGIVPHAIGEPSAVLLNLLTLLVNYTQRISGSTDVVVGENPGQNTAISNMNNMLEQGLKIYSAIFKRMWRSMRDEFRKCYLLNARHSPPMFRFGKEMMGRELFMGDPSQLVPTADPQMVSESMKQNQAIAIKQAAMATPGYNIEEVERNFLRAMNVDGVNILYPGLQKFPPKGDPKNEIKAQQIQLDRERLQFEAQRFATELQEEKRLNTAKIVELKAKAAEILAGIQGEAEARELARFEAQIGAAQAQEELLNRRLEVVGQLTQQRNDESTDTSGDGGDAGGMAVPSGDTGGPAALPAPAPGLDEPVGGGELPQ